LADGRPAAVGKVCDLAADAGSAKSQPIPTRLNAELASFPEKAKRRG
jgi:hypothetical protein